MKFTLSVFAALALAACATDKTQTTEVDSMKAVASAAKNVSLDITGMT